jgi:signal peptidase I
MQLSNKVGVFFSFSLILFFIIGIYFLSTRWILGISPSDSLFTHIFIVDKNNKDVKKGDIVGFHYQGKEIYHFKKGDKFLKYIACEAGELLTMKDRKYYCNDVFISEAIKINSYGDNVEMWEYNGVIPKGKFFTFAPYEFSYDSRYWGFVDRDEIIGKAYEVF